MINQVPQNISVYSSAYRGIYPTMIENHTNSEAEQFRNKLNDEIKVKQAYVRMEFLKNTLEKHGSELTKPQKNVLNAELTDAQRDIVLLQQQLNTKYGVQLKYRRSNKISFNYGNYVKSFYANDQKILQKRRNQSKAVSIAAATTGTVAAGLTLLPKNKVKWLTGILSVVSLLGALNTHNYVKQADKKLAEFDTNA